MLKPTKKNVKGEEIADDEQPVVQQSAPETGETSLLGVLVKWVIEAITGAGREQLEGTPARTPEELGIRLEPEHKPITREVMTAAQSIEIPGMRMAPAADVSLEAPLATPSQMAAPSRDAGRFAKH